MTETRSRITVVGRPERPLPPGGTFDNDRERSVASTKLARRLPLVVSAAAAAPAIALPRAWLLVVATVAFAVACRQHARGDGGGSAALLLAPVQTVAAAVRAAPRAMLWLLAAAVICVAVPALFAGAAWAVTESSTGMITSARLTAVEWSPALLAAAACFGLLRPAVRRLATHGTATAPFEHVEELTVTLLAGTSALILALIVLMFSPASLRAADLLPRGLVDGLEERWAEAQTDAVLRCLAARSVVDWSATLSRNGASELSLSVKQAPENSVTPTREELTGLVLALHHQLLGSVGRISVRRTHRYEPIIIPRADLDLRARPSRDTAALAAAAGVGADVLPESRVAIDQGLTCGGRFP